MACSSRYAQHPVFVVRDKGAVIAMLQLAIKKPWAIDRTCFTPVKRQLYLTSMGVYPEHQNRGIGRHCLAQALAIIRVWPVDAIFLDALDGSASAGGFYAKCGYRQVGRKTCRGVPLMYYELLA